MQEATWAKEKGREELLKKIDSLKLALPVVSYFKNRDSLYSEYNVSEVKHSSFPSLFSHLTIILLK